MTDLVRVHGTWNGVGLSHASVSVLDTDPTIERCFGGGELLPEDLDQQGVKQIFNDVAGADADTFISGGGMEGAFWSHVRHVTPEFAEVLNQLPVRHAVVAAVTPD
ncbi:MULTISPECIES: hypothetical protein [unclassified Microbacterium]|uniref:hypothetical protein n=1 Tax=unclassified Microbacterium TaxID=2609290 RepID=UPI0012F8CD60|nr:hypothetical protein [Microbacterium sp. MAH-37]MVQ41405.1 hypothetical protein [Microbacterium sp. MAH-37]